MHDDPSQGELGHGDALGQDLAQLFNRLEPLGKIHARECLPAVKGLAFAVEGAMIIRLEPGGARHPAREQAACQRHTYNDADPP